MNVQMKQLKEVFLAALEKDDPEERQRFLDQACAANGALRRLVELLLARNEEAGAFLEQPAVELLLTEDGLEELSSPSSEDRATPQHIGGDTQVLNNSSTPPAESGDDFGSYRLKRLLGEGGMGLVFAAEDLQLRRLVALKVLRPDSRERPKMRERFLREARAAAAVKHEHVVTIYQVGETDGIPFLVMELLEGESLGRRCQTGPPLALTEVVRIGREVAEGLAAAHATGLTHRDIKPDNIWLEAPHDRVKLLDFGLACAASGEVQLTQPGQIVGTPAYMAPEQASGKPVDARADLFSLGAVLYRLVTGEQAFRGESALEILHALANVTPPPLRTLNRDIPESLSRLVAELMARRPEDRPASAQAVVVALTVVEGELAIRMPAQLTRPPRRRLLGVLVVGLLALLVAGATVFQLQTDKGEKGGAVTAAIPARPTGPLDVLKRENIPDEVLAWAGGGDKAKAPAELVAVLGGPQHFRHGAGYQYCSQTAFSSDGRWLAVLSDRQLLLYEAATGKLVHSLAHDAGCSWFDFRPDLKVIAVCTEQAVELWDLTTGTPAGRLKEGVPVATALSYTRDGKSVLTTDGDGKTRLWDVATKTAIRTFEPPEGHRYLQAPQVHRDGRLIALHASGPKPLVRVLDITNGDKVAELPGTGFVPGIDGLQYQTTVRFSPDGKWLATVRAGQAIQLWDVSTWKEAAVFEGFASILNFSADSSILYRAHVSNGRGAHIMLTEVKSGLTRTEHWLPVPADFGWSDLSPDGKTVAVRTLKGNCLTLFDAATGKARLPLVGHQARVTSVAVSPNGRWLLSTGRDHRTLLWDLAKIDNRVRSDAVQELHFSAQLFHEMTGAAFSSDSTRAAALIQHDHAIQLWDTATGKAVLALPVKDRQGVDVAFHPAGRSVTVAARNRLEQWLLADSAVTTWEEGQAHALETVDYHPQGHQVATGDHGGKVCIWDVASHKRLREFACPAPVLRLRFSPDGLSLAATTSAPDSALYLWDLETGAKTRRSGPTGQVSALAWRPDSKALMTAGDDATLRLWYRAGDKGVRSIGLPGRCSSVAFAPDGRHLFTANEDGSIFALRLEPEPKTDGQ